MPSPAWRATRSLIAAGTGGEGGTGSPGAPQPAETRKMEKRKCRMRKNCAGRFSMRDLVPVLFSIFQFQQLQDVAAETRSEEHTSELQSHHDLVCRLLLEKKKKKKNKYFSNKN